MAISANDTIRIGIIGCGGIANGKHMPGLRSVSYTHLVGDRGKDGKMDIKEILSHVDHTELSPAARLDDIKLLIDDAIKYSTATVCICLLYTSSD